ncbi:uncharacterized protein FOMMEDRAFT_16588, partial [Fomitiporia mediterranea MF3/22]|uniref:uncharacterized protein n=1 Tax=Fomitiporia mediterranea (strain MF3/22) TaxID=694068 RepID=UPI0004409935
MPSLRTLPSGRSVFISSNRVLLYTDTTTDAAFSTLHLIVFVPDVRALANSVGGC